MVFGVDDVIVITPLSLTDVVDKHDVDPLIFLNGESTSSGVSPKFKQFINESYLYTFIYTMK